MVFRDLLLLVAFFIIFTASFSLLSVSFSHGLVTEMMIVQLL
jgi:hypothetical protein